MEGVWIRQSVDVGQRFETGMSMAWVGDSPLLARLLGCVEVVSSEEALNAR